MSCRGEHGFSLPMAIFVVVILAFAGAMMLNLSGAQRQTAVLSHQGARAFSAARSGVEWGIEQAMGSGTCPATTTLTLSEGGLKGFSTQVSCTSTQHTESGATFRVFVLTSVATYGSFGDRDYVRRRLQVTAANAT